VTSSSPARHAQAGLLRPGTINKDKLGTEHSRTKEADISHSERYSPSALFNDSQAAGNSGDGAANVGYLQLSLLTLARIWIGTRMLGFHPASPLHRRVRAQHSFRTTDVRQRHHRWNNDGLDSACCSSEPLPRVARRQDLCERPTPRQAHEGLQNSSPISRTMPRAFQSSTRLPVPLCVTRLSSSWRNPQEPPVGLSTWFGMRRRKHEVGCEMLSSPSRLPNLHRLLRRSPLLYGSVRAIDATSLVACGTV